MTMNDTASELLAPPHPPSAGMGAMVKRGGLRMTPEMAKQLDTLDGECSANMREALELGLPRLTKKRRKRKGKK